MKGEDMRTGGPRTQDFQSQNAITLSGLFFHQAVFSAPAHQLWRSVTDPGSDDLTGDDQFNPAILLAPSYVRREFTVTPAGSNCFYRVRATIAP